MADFPALEVMTPGPHGLAVGHRIALKDQLVLGRASGNGVNLLSALVARRHCEVVFEHERWWVRDLGSSNGTFMAGESINDTELRHGDCFELPHGVVFRLLLREPEDLRDEAMERGIFEAPDDAHRWSVYADWLQERGAPLGERMLAPRTEDDASWLGPVSGDAARDELGVTWAHGLPSSLRLSSRSNQFSDWSWERRLSAMLRLPEFRFVRGLEIDLGSFYRAPVAVSWAAQVLELLGGAWPLLEKLSFGPGSVVDDVEGLKAPLERFKRAHARVSGAPASFFRPWRAATLTLESLVPNVVASRSSLPLATDALMTVGRSFRVGHSPNDELTLTAPWPIPLFIISFTNDRYRVHTDRGVAEPIRLNGVKVSEAFLRPGDVLEPTAGVRLRFAA